MRLVCLFASSLTLAGCMTSSDLPTPLAQAPAQPVPVQAVTSTALPPVGGSSQVAMQSGASTTTTTTSTAPPVTTSALMGRAPGARESASLSNVSHVRSGAATSGSPLGGTIVSGQQAGAIPSVVDRNREPVRVRRTAPVDPLGPGTAPPIIAPELRDQTGNTLRNRQRVDF
ncbi:hypothetical protein E8L99_16850 [Phreatobacter aquaticus]|uniref:DUF3035 domain-containing protein n=1 Tax=Phreatobacter aquaticus TaxID=2570229 RepID=A0A4D7QP13_9HYPH|nr:hypothetical protein [Phreatobacter aquaticus]QCK87306.1 hypothetical protein E8L99_16850 [Phreatobacter aquaticus]